MVLFSFKTLHTYGLIVALSIFLGFEYVMRSAKRFGVSEKITAEFSFYVLLFGLAGARVFHVVAHWPAYSANPIDILKVWEVGGMAFLPGIISGAIGARVLCLIKKMDFWFIADVFSPAIPLGHFFGQLGSFFAGRCYGNKGLHPTQLYEAFLNILIFFVIYFFSRKKHSAGKAFLLYIILFSSINFMMKYFRGDEKGAFVMGLSCSQVISIVFFALAWAIWIRKSHRSSKSS